MDSFSWGTIKGIKSHISLLSLSLPLEGGDTARRTASLSKSVRIKRWQPTAFCYGRESKLQERLSSFFLFTVSASVERAEARPNKAVSKQQSSRAKCHIYHNNELLLWWPGGYSQCVPPLRR